MKVNRTLITFITILMALCASAQSHKDVSVSQADVWKAYEAFNKVYLDTDKYIYKNTDRDRAALSRSEGAAAIWCQPMYVDMAINARDLADARGDKKRRERYDRLLRNVIDGNIAHYAGFDFDDANENTGWFIYDDIQWWTITLARAYNATGDPRLLDLSARSYARVWYGSPRVGDTGSYADPAKGLKGGMFWQWQPLHAPRRNEADHGKMSCINVPTVVAAMLLYDAMPDSVQPDPAPERWTNGFGSFERPSHETKARYLEMAKEIYDWAEANLVDMNTGRVWDSSHGGRPGGHPLIYNQGTYIGASALLYLATGEQRYLDSACRAADFCINDMSAEHGMLPWAHNPRNPYDQGSLEQGVYPAIWAEYMKILIRDCGMTKYMPFLEHNIAQGWANRDRKRNICDGESWKATDNSNVIGSYAASSVPALMLVTFQLKN